MDQEKLKEAFLGSLQKMYDMELAAPLMEFCQGEMRVLLYLDSHKEGPAFPSDLSEALFVTRQRITTILSTLRKKGYITMVTSKSDRRRTQVTLSKAGCDYVIERRRFVERYLEMLIESLGEENMLEFNRLIQLTANRMEGLSK